MKNPNLIADMVDKDIRLSQKEPLPLPLKGRRSSFKKLPGAVQKQIYGDPLPEIVSARLDKELTSIIKHGFAVFI